MNALQGNILDNSKKDTCRKTRVILKQALLMENSEIIASIILVFWQFNIKFKSKKSVFWQELWDGIKRTNIYFKF